MAFALYNFMNSTLAFDVPPARAIVFGMHISGVIRRAEWVPVPLITPLIKEMQYEPPVLESAAEPHVDCEAEIANFLGTPDSILYSYGLFTMFSAVPAFSKKGDIIVADEGVHWGIQNGLFLSRSTVMYFKHK